MGHVSITSENISPTTPSVHQQIYSVSHPEANNSLGIIDSAWPGSYSSQFLFYLKSWCKTMSIYTIPTKTMTQQKRPWQYPTKENQVLK